ncbi:AfsR/SARP family transcriptional regulator [Nonomuraea sp. NPDC001023]|uniref:AfsR/SARP family transcriptional regulator n=1 Tax=unclassified Nonomuraea TaxID=2593643 RepID=UPI00332215F2
MTDGEHDLSLRSIQQRTLLALLLCHHGTVARSDVLIDALWGSGAGEAGARRLRLQLHRLRHTLGDRAPIIHRSTGYRLDVPREAVDALRFEDLVRRGRTLIQSGNDPKGGDLIRSALAMWRGPALSGLSDISLLHHQATRLEEQRLGALVDRIEADLRLRRHADLVAELSDLVREHPLREKFRGQLMIALYRTGRQSDALEVYREGRRILAADLGLEPSQELRRLELAILTSDSSLAPGHPPAAAKRPVHRRLAPRHAAGCPHCARYVR